MVTITETLEGLCRSLDAQEPRLTLLDRYYSGESAMAYLSPEAAEALGKRLRTLSVNFCKLLVDSLSERLAVTGFKVDGQDVPGVWPTWSRSLFEDGHGQVHSEALISGRAYVMVWADENGRAALSVESCREVAVKRHPLTRQVVAAVKRWTDPDAKRARAILFLPDAIREYVSSAEVPPGGFAPSVGWVEVSKIPNPLGRVPVVEFVNRGRLLDVQGVAEFAPIVDLQDGLVKVLTDALVSSEYFSRPRRWATGLELVINEETGQPENPFVEGPLRVWQSESPDTKFGQFEPGDLSGYGQMVQTFTQLVGAVSALPPHYLSPSISAPTSADAIRSAESGLVARAEAKQALFGPSWGQVAALASAVEGGPMPERVDVVWRDPATRTLAQSADASVKLFTAGVIGREAAQRLVGFSPEEIAQMRTDLRIEALDRVTLGGDLQ